MNRMRQWRRRLRPGSSLWISAVAASVIAANAFAQANPGGGNGPGSPGGAGPGVGATPLPPAGPPGPLGQGGPGGGGILGQDAGTGTMTPAGPNGSTTPNWTTAQPAPSTNVPLNPAPPRGPGADGAGR